MRYRSTRSIDTADQKAQTFSFQEAVLTGIADDGGLFMPVSIPNVSKYLPKWSKLNFHDLAFEILSLYIDRSDIPAADLRMLINKAYAAELWSSNEIAPVKQVGTLYIQELWHGPTLAFKDIAMQFIGHLLEYYLSKQNRKVTLVISTSGDTGPAAIYAIKGKPSSECYVLFPTGMVSERQAKQMTGVSDANVHVYSVAGSSDDMDIVVKNLNADLKFKKENGLCSINSFNWARIVLQTIHFFYSYFRVTAGANYGGAVGGNTSASAKAGSGSGGGRNPQSAAHAVPPPPRVNFALPTGALGNGIAGVVCWAMGLPIHRLVYATNENDVISRLFHTGIYEKPPTLIPTISPAIDIQVPYNIERIFYFMARFDTRLVKQWMVQFEKTNRVEVPRKYRQELAGLILAEASDQKETFSAIQDGFKYHGYIMDPHTAVGVRGVEKALKFKAFGLQKTVQPLHPVILLSTAHPSKFESTIIKAVGFEAHIPQSMKELLDARDHHQMVSKTDAPNFEARLRKEIIVNYSKATKSAATPAAAIRSRL